MIMLTLLICFTGLSLVIFIAGVIWILVTRGQTQRTTGPEAGKKVMESDDLDEEDGAVVYSNFKGKATYVEREASIGLGDVKAAIANRDWGTLIALLMLVCGALGMCLCGGLSILLAV